MEAAVRVFQILLGDGDDKILVKLQPSVAGHPTFTECFIVSKGHREDDSLFFIEVKKSSDSADICELRHFGPQQSCLYRWNRPR